MNGTTDNNHEHHATPGIAPGKRWCYYIPPGQRDDNGYIPSVVTEGEAGHSPLIGRGDCATPWYWGDTYDEAVRACDDMNERMGITKHDAAVIVASSMNAPPGQSAVTTGTAIHTLWNALHGYRETQIPEGTPEYDEQWDDICTAMAQLAEAGRPVVDPDTFWTHYSADPEAAQKGYDVFETVERGYEIERIDDLKMFATDRDATMACLNDALAGDRHAAELVRWVLTQEPPGVAPLAGERGTRTEYVRIADAVYLIDSFEQDCNEAEHTDTGKAWEVLNRVRTILNRKRPEPGKDYECSKCHGHNVEICLPAYFDPNRGDELVSIDGEADPLTTWCRDCDENEPLIYHESNDRDVEIEGRW